VTAVDIRRYLEGWVFMQKQGGIQAGKEYRSDFEFVLRHGIEFPIAAVQPRKRMPIKRCFYNSYLAAITHGLRYCEGWALTSRVPLAVHHAWNLNDAGEVVEYTWKDGAAYLGVEFSIARAADAIVNSDSGAVLDDWRRHHPILQQPWIGETRHSQRRDNG